MKTSNVLRSCQNRFDKCRSRCTGTLEQWERHPAPIGKRQEKHSEAHSCQIGTGREAWVPARRDRAGSAQWGAAGGLPTRAKPSIQVARTTHPPIGLSIILFSSIYLLQAGCTSTSTGSPSTLSTQQGLFSHYKGTPWTLLCTELQGTYRKDHAQQLAETLKRTPGIDADRVFVRDEENYTRLYYGTYFRRADPQTGKREIPKKLADDLKLLHELSAGDAANPIRVFPMARIVRMPLENVGPQEWNLEGAPGVYSLQVAAFEPTDDFRDFKRAAAEYCNELRRRGYEAYYHHGQACSIVTVGTFDDSALIEVRPGINKYSDEVERLRQDELLRYNRLNGAVIRSRQIMETIDKTWTGDVKRGSKDNHVFVPVPSQLVKIPHHTKEDWQP